MLSDDECKAASAHLTGLWRARRQEDHLPETLRPTSRADAYRIQACLEEMPGAEVAGWKIAATSAAGQAHINVDGPLAGRILKDRLVAGAEAISLAGNNMRVAELEFGFRLGRDLAPKAGGYTTEEVEEAVADLLPTIEVPASRYTDFCAVGAEALIADNSCADLFWFGPAFDPAEWRERDLAAWTVTAQVDGSAPVPGVGANVLGDPWIALSWLVNECSAHGIPLAKGQVVSTGTCVVPVAVHEGCQLTADYGLGEPITLRFA